VTLVSSARRPLTVTTILAIVAALLVLGAPADASGDAARLAEREFIALANIERAKAGVGALTERSDIRTVARSWSLVMADRTQLGHNPSFSQQITGWQRVSENVGRGPSVASLHQALMASEGHRRNILDERMTEVGVGVVIRDGRVWVTQNFRRPKDNVVTAPPTLTIFGDVSSRSLHAAAIRTVTAQQIEDGCSPARFCPDGSVTRGQFASMLVRAMGIPPTSQRRFTDTAGPHAADIEALVAAGIGNGCGPDTFCPDQRLSRAHLSTFMARALRFPPATSPFTDAPSNHAGAIGALYSRGIVKGCTATRFCPTETVNRAQTASMLSRAFG
jgi:hypothetical protein